MLRGEGIGEKKKKHRLENQKKGYTVVVEGVYFKSYWRLSVQKQVNPPAVKPQQEKKMELSRFKFKTFDSC